VPVPVTVTRPRRPRLRAALVLGLASLALAACGTDLAGAASVVGTQTVRDAEVAAAVEEVRAQFEAAQGLPDIPAFSEAEVTSRNVERMTRHLVLEAAAAEKGIVVTPGQVDEVIASSIDGQFEGSRERFDLAFATQEFVPASAVVQFARDFLIRQALPARVLPGGTEEAQGEAASAYLGELSTKLDVRVAARYGTWDPSLNGLGPVPDDLSFVPGAKPAATPSPAPSSS
jgi:SurA N-terminal domain